MAIPVWCLFLLGGTFLSPQASANADGTFTVNDKTTELHYAHAREGKDPFDPTKREIRVVLSDVPITDEDMEDPFALDDKKRAGKLHAVEVRFSLKGEPIGGSLYHEAFGGGHVTVSGMHLFERKTWDDKTIAGKLYMEKPDDFMEKTFQYTATFSTALDHEAKPTAEGPAAAASGPGKALLEYVRAARGRDVAALKRICTAEGAQKFEGQQGALILDELAKYFRATTRFQIVRVFESGDHAKVEAREKGALVVAGEVAGSTAVYKTVRVNGEWKVAD